MKQVTHFSILFGLVIFCYQLCAAGVAIERIIFLVFGFDEGLPFKRCSPGCLEALGAFVTIIDYVVNCSYSGITALFLSCLIGRLATIGKKNLTFQSVLWLLYSRKDMSTLDSIYCSSRYSHLRYFSIFSGAQDLFREP